MPSLAGPCWQQYETSCKCYTPHPVELLQSLYAKPGANHLVLRRRRGFIKVALRTGVPLVPVYAFGENSTFR